MASPEARHTTPTARWDMRRRAAEGDGRAERRGATRCPRGGERACERTDRGQSWRWAHARAGAQHRAASPGPPLWREWSATMAGGQGRAGERRGEREGEAEVGGRGEDLAPHDGT